MKIKKPLYIATALFFSMSQQVANAGDDYPLGDDIETPDTLLQAAEPDKKKVVYGEDNIVIFGDGDKQNDIIKPDPILSTVNTEKPSSSKDIKLQLGNVTEEDKAIEHDDQLLKTTDKKKSVKKGSGSEKQNELEMPDPLLDSVN